MEEAVHHDWLAGPSSQRSESQRQKLGGDSMWSIESFEGDSGSPGSEENVDHPWTRPTTISGTNLASALGGNSEESFSQPMGKLRINTPGMRPAERHIATPEFLGLNGQPSGQDDDFLGVEQPDHAPAISVVPAIPVEPSPPSPALTDELVHRKRSPRSDERHNPFLNSVANGNGSVLKRKLNDATPAAGRGDVMFSSGSLSPPPEAEDRSITPGKRDSVLPSPKSTVASPALQQPTQARTRRGGTAIMQGVAEVPDDQVATRQSGRMSTRARKSLRVL